MKLIFIIIASIFLTACHTTMPLPIIASNTSAKKLFENKHYKESLIIFEQENTPEAQYYLGKAYLYGLGCDRDVDKAYKYAKKSAEAKYPAGINLFAILYLGGYGIEKDEMTALVYFKQAAELNNTLAIKNIAQLYTSGTLVKKDYKKATKWYLRAIDNGDERAYLNIGDMYYRDYKDDEALKYYLLYDTSESIKYNERVALIYYSKKEYRKAYKYFLIASKLGSYTTTFNLYDIVRNNPDLNINKQEAIDWLIKSADNNNNKTKSLKLSQNLLYMYYFDDTNQHQKAMEFARSAYYNGNIEMGCQLAFQLMNYTITPSVDLQRAYDISSKIISENTPSRATQSCYSTLSYLYLSGNYTARNFQNAIKLKKIQFDDIYEKKYAGVSESIAKLYLERLHDYKDAQRWYQITYDITKDKSYLSKVNDFKKALSNFKDKGLSGIKQKVYPVIENFTSKEQVVTVLESQKYYFIALSQKSINMYDKTSLKLIKTFKGWIGVGIEGVTVQMAYDEKKKLLYCAGLNSTVDLSKNDLIKVFDVQTGKIVNTINNKNSIKNIYLNISNDGKYLVAINGGQQLNIINTLSNKIQYYNFSNIVHFTHINIIKKDGDYLVSALGNDKNLYTFSVNKKRQVSKEAYVNQIQFKTFNGTHAQSILKNNLNNFSSIKNVMLNNNQLYLKTSKVNSIKKFNLKSLTLLNANKKIYFPPEAKSNIDIQYKNYNTSVKIYKNKQLLSNVEFFNTPVLKHKIINNKYIILTTNDITAMYIFNLQGKPIAKLKGFLSIQTNIIYQRGYLITYGNDNIIHLWSIDNLNQLNKIKESYDDEILYSMSKIIGDNPLEIFDAADEDLLEIAELQSRQNNLPYILTPKQFKSYCKMLLLKKEEIYPLSSLYIQNNDWIIYNNKGYFTSSKNGKNLIRYHLNQGLKKEAKIIDNTQIFKKFYRPDIIRKLLAKEMITDSLDIKQVLKNINPPTISILKNKMKDKKNLELTYRICDSGSGISNTSILLNKIQRNISNSRGFSIEKKEANNNCTVYRNIITLQSGKNSIAIKSFDKTKTISTTTIPIEVIGKFEAPKKSNLHFLSIAVSNYKDDSLRLKYSVSDANAVMKKIKLHSRKLFKKIYTYELHEKDVTLNKIDAIFNKVSAKAEINDVFILYIIGHGVTNSKDGLYYYLPYDVANAGLNSLKKSAVSINNIIHQLGKIKAHKSLILLDTCDSGSAIDNDAVVKRLSNATQRNYIVASSNNQVALEGYKNYGVFTYTVLEAFDKAYFGDDKTLTVTSLAAFVEKNVPKITKEQFHYEQSPQKYLNGDLFPIGFRND